MGAQMLGHDDDNVVEGDFEDISSLQGDIDAQLDAIIGEFAGEKDLSAKIKVYQVKPNGGKMAWVFDCLPEELPILERVRDEFGPGDYLSRLYIGGKLTKTFQFSIAAPSRSYAAANKSGGSEIAALGEIMRQNFESMREMMQANNRQQGGMDAALDQLIKMKELFGADRGGSSIKELQEMVLLVDTLRGDGGDNEPKGVMDVLSGIVDKALPALSQAAAAGQQQQARKKNPAARQVQREQQQTQQQKPQPEDNSQMKMKLMYLCSMAEKNADPATYAGMIVDASTEQQLIDLVELLKTDDWLEKFGKYHADVLNYRAWFAEVRAFIMDEVSPQLEDGEQLDEVDSGEGADDNQEKSATEKPGNVPETSENADNHHA